MELEKTSTAKEFIGGIAERLGATAKAATIFGEPVERDGITVIPVGKARWGFGGGVGRRKDEDGAGGGGGAQVSPVGFIELKDGHANFRPIRPLPLPWIFASGVAAFFLLRRILGPNARR